MQRILIVNADDANLTPGVTQAILDAHERGIVSSATWLVNLPANGRDVRQVKSRRSLGIGLHLNVTLAGPVSAPAKVRSLLDAAGTFKKFHKRQAVFPKPGELRLEYENQILLFKKTFGRLPTHLDTHHQLHDIPFFYEVIAHLAAKYRLPIRRSRLLLSKSFSGRTTDYFFGNFSPDGYWRPLVLETVLKCLPEGASEIMCHPGYETAELRAVSSFTHGRLKEYHLFARPDWQALLKALSIRLSDFGKHFAR